MKILKGALYIIQETHYVGEHDVIELFFGLQLSSHFPACNILIASRSSAARS
jgi:hypothetical protein